MHASNSKLGAWGAREKYSPTNMRKLLDMLERRVRCMQTILDREHELHVKSNPQPLSMSYVFSYVFVYCVYCV